MILAAIIFLFSKYLFPHNKTFQNKVEAILENFITHNKNSEYFEYLLSFLKTHELPIKNQPKFIQTKMTSISAVSTQTDSLKTPIASDSSRNEVTNLIKIIEKMKKKGQELDFNTTSTSLESKPDKTNNFSKNENTPTNKIISQTNNNRNIVSKEKFVTNKRNLTTFKNLKSSFQDEKKNTEVESQTFRSKKTIESLHFLNKTTKTERNNEPFYKTKTEKNEVLNSTKELFTMKEFATEEDLDAENEVSGNIEEKISKEVFEHIQKINQKNEKNYSKIKFLFKYPFRSINAKFDEKKKLEKEKKEDEEYEEDNFTYDRFKKFFNRMIKMHKRCGGNCIHLRRFYQKIGFQMKVPLLKEEMIISKNIINKLPKIF